MKPRSAHWLVYDLQVSGHHPEYLAHLISGQAHSDRRVRLSFVVHPTFFDSHQDLVACLRRSGRGEVIAADAAFAVEVADMDPRMRARAEWDYARRRARRLGARRILFPFLNLPLYALGAAMNDAEKPSVAGILFSPGVRTEIRWRRPVEAVRTLASRLRKVAVIRWLLRYPALGPVFILNDEATVRTLNRMTPRRRPFRYVVDPVPEVPAGTEEVASLRALYGIDRKKRILLLLGSLSRRKGVTKTLDAVQRLGGTCDGIALLLLGRVDPELRPRLQEAKESFDRSGGQLQLVVDDRFLSNAEVAAAYRDCDIVLAPYQSRHDASSGSLSHAARHGKPIITPEHDLIARLNRTYGLGAVTDTTDPSRLAQAIANVVKGRVCVDSKGAQRYVDERTPERFASTILSALEFDA